MRQRMGRRTWKLKSGCLHENHFGHPLCGVAMKRLIVGTGTILKYEIDGEMKFYFDKLPSKRVQKQIHRYFADKKIRFVIERLEKP